MAGTNEKPDPPISAYQFKTNLFDIEKSTEEGKKRTFTGVAYSGEVIQSHYYWGDVIFDLDTIQMKTPLCEVGMNGIRLEFAQFGDFDSFDVIRFTSSMAGVADADLPSPIATGLTTMYYVDTTVVEGYTYYYRVRVWRDDVGVVSSEVECVADRDKYWSFVTALLHFDDDLVDAANKSIYTKTSGIVFSENGALNGKSIAFNRNYDYITTTQKAPWTFKGYDFCIEFFVRLNDNSNNYETIISKWGSSLNTCEFNISRYDGKFSLDVRANNGTSYVPLLLAPQPPANQRIHVAFSREGNIFRLFYAGILQQEKTSSVIINESAYSILKIGGSDEVQAPSINGYLDELRVTKGSARYTENFTPPVKPFLNQ